MTAAALDARQTWWIGTVIATAIGIGLFSETKTILPKIAAILLLAATASGWCTASSLV